MGDNPKLYTKCEIKKGFLGTPWFSHGLDCTEAKASDLPPTKPVPDMIGINNNGYIQDLTCSPGGNVHCVVDNIQIHQSTGDEWNGAHAPEGTLMWCMKGHLPGVGGKPDKPIVGCLASGTFEEKK